MVAGESASTEFVGDSASDPGRPELSPTISSPFVLSRLRIDRANDDFERLCIGLSDILSACCRDCLDCHEALRGR